jgi:16S rRNA (guanine1207-N2)-methyltransferase
LSEDVFFKKIISFNFRKQTLQYKTSQDLFSSHEVDPGTQFLLRTITEAGYSSPHSVLDMGCGYGPLGLTLGSLYRNAEVHLVDRDALSVDYTCQNAELNGLSGTMAYGSLGYDDLKKCRFELIVSNIPGKAGEPVISYLLREAGYYLAPGGIVAIVVVTPLEQLVTKTLADTPQVEIVLRRTRPGHTVFHYRFIEQSGGKPSEVSLERGIYTRRQLSFHFGDLTFPMYTAWGLPEFDSLDFRTQILLDAVSRLGVSNIQRAAVFNPGQGHLPIIVRGILHPEKIILVDRDLLALRYSSLNLLSSQYPAEKIDLFHQAGLGLEKSDSIDLWAGVLREEEGPEAIVEAVRQAAQSLSSGGHILLSAGSTAITRLVSYLQLHKFLHIKRRDKRHGCSLVVLEKD